MADLMPKNHNEVLLTFSDKSIGLVKFPARNISLNTQTKTCQIGRSSSRYNANLSASSTNAWFDNAVMSRKHAEFIWDAATQLVSVRDTGSLHGTTLNGFKLPEFVKKRIQVGDVLKFGAPVEKELRAFHPAEVQIRSIDLGPPELPLNEVRTNTFTVPDDSEPEEASDGFDSGEDLYSDSDDGGVARSALLVQQSNIQPAQTLERHVYPTTIDLTVDQVDVLDVLDVLEEDPMSLPEQTPDTASTKRMPATTFAPALQGRDSVEPLDSDASIIAEDPESSDPALPEFTDSLFDDDLDATLNLASVDVGGTTAFVNNPVMPSSSAPASALAEREPLSESRQMIVNRLALETEFRERTEESISVFPKEGRASLDQLPLTFGQKRKFADVDQDAAQSHQRRFEVHSTSLSETANLSQLSGGPTPKNVTPISVSELVSHPKNVEKPQAAQIETMASSQSEPPRKRIRRVAEAVGYAALGGIAVMSALIATAPDL
jgi:pSer/pThr/pTyr-binding forkhead associated (FHA) protein